MTELSGRVAIVTGAAQGIGRGVAAVLARRGADLALWDLKIAELAFVRDEIEELGRRCVAIEVDVAKRAQVERAVRSTVQELGASTYSSTPRAYTAPFSFGICLKEIGIL